MLQAFLKTILLMVTLEQWFWPRDKCLEIFLVVMTVGRAARDAARHPAPHWLFPSPKAQPAPQAGGAEVEKPCCVPDSLLVLCACSLNPHKRHVR